MDRTEDRSKEPKTKLVLDDGRIESIQEFISPEELYQDLIERVLLVTLANIFRTMMRNIVVQTVCGC